MEGKNEQENSFCRQQHGLRDRTYETNTVPLQEKWGESRQNANKLTAYSAA